jgi:hypothetical protein
MKESFMHFGKSWLTAYLIIVNRLANANKAIEKSTKFINKIRSRQLACANFPMFLKDNNCYFPIAGGSFNF